MRPSDSPRGLDEDGSRHHIGAMSGENLLSWGTCRTEMGIIMVAGVFLTLGLGLLLYVELMAQKQPGMGDDPGLLFAILPAMTLFLYLGVVMVVVTLFMGGAPSEAGGSGWSLGTRVSFLAFLLSVEGMIYLGRTGEATESSMKLFIYLFGGELAFVVIFWSLYQRSVAKWVGRSGAAGLTIPFMILGVACVAVSTFQILESAGFLGMRVARRMPDENKLALISTAALVVLSLFQAVLAGSIRSGVKDFVLRNMHR